MQKYKWRGETPICTWFGTKPMAMGVWDVNSLYEDYFTISYTLLSLVVHKNRGESLREWCLIVGKEARKEAAPVQEANPHYYLVSCWWALCHIVVYLVCMPQFPFISIICLPNTFFLLYVTLLVPSPSLSLVDSSFMETCFLSWDIFVPYNYRANLKTGLLRRRVLRIFK